MWIALLVIAGLAAGGMGAALLFTAPGRNEIKNLSFAAIDFAQLRDGVYIGEYVGEKDSFRNAKVQVTVSSGEIADIKVLQGALDKAGEPAKLTRGLTIDDLFGRVVASQSLQVDVISGATLTSKAHLKAVENALLQAQAK